MLLHAEALGDTQFLHIADHALVHVESRRGVALVQLGSQVLNQLGRVVARVISNRGGDGSQRSREGLDGHALLALHSLRQSLDRVGHSNFSVAAAEDNLGVFERLHEHAECVMERPLSLVENMSAGATEDDGAGLVGLAAREFNDLVLTQHLLLDELALSEHMQIGLVEGAQDLRAQHGRESLGAIEVGVLDDHHSFLGHELLRVVVDELSVDEHIWLVR